MMFPPRLSTGYQDFLADRLPLERSRYEKLAQTGQRPEVMVISCCDSRVSPETIFDAHPGELFVLRNVANLVPPYNPTGLVHGVSAALEFAVQILKVKYILVIGHSHCGGVRAFVEHRDRPNLGDFIDNWMSLIAPAARIVDQSGQCDTPEYLSRLERTSAVATLNNLMTFPEVAKRVNAGDLHLLAGYFDVGTGDLTIHDPDTNAFVHLHDLMRRQNEAAQ
jgi:carbonic anhydrase